MQSVYEILRRSFFTQGKMGDFGLHQSNCAGYRRFPSVKERLLAGAWNVLDNAYRADAAPPTGARISYFSPMFIIRVNIVTVRMFINLLLASASGKKFSQIVR